MQAMIILFMRKPLLSFFKKGSWYRDLVDLFLLAIQLLLVVCTISIMAFNLPIGVSISVGVLTLIYLIIALTASIASYQNLKKAKTEESLCMTIHSFPWCFTANLIVFTVSFVVSIKFFTQKSMDNSIDQAKSREFNQECIIGFFDQHDIWHFSSCILLVTQLVFLKYFQKYRDIFFNTLKTQQENKDTLL